MLGFKEIENCDMDENYDYLKNINQIINLKNKYRTNKIFYIEQQKNLALLDIEVIKTNILKHNFNLKNCKLKF